MNLQSKAPIVETLREIWARDLKVADEIFAADCVHHFYDQVTGWRIGGPQGYCHIVRLFRTAFPNARLCLELDNGKPILLRWRLSGHHRGELLGIEPSGREVTVAGIEIFRFEHDKVRESWASWDILGFLERLARFSSLEPQDVLPIKKVV